MTSATVVGTLDTKGDKFAFVNRHFVRTGMLTTVIDIGVLDNPRFAPDTSSDRVCQATGTPMAAPRERGVKSQAICAVAAGLFQLVRDHHEREPFDGIFSMGGSSGTPIAATAVRELPLRMPKLIVSSIVGGERSSDVRSNDIEFEPDIVNIAGLNRTSLTPRPRSWLS